MITSSRRPRRVRPHDAPDLNIPENEAGARPVGWRPSNFVRCVESEPCAVTSSPAARGQEIQPKRDAQHAGPVTPFWAVSGFGVNARRCAMQRSITMPTTKREPFCRFPNEVMRNKRLGPAARVIAAYQATFVGDYTIDAAALRKDPIARAGLGRDVIERANKELCAAGYKKRWQPPSAVDGTFTKAVEKLALPPCGATGKAGRIVYRKWFDAQLSVNEMAAYLYFRAGTGRGPMVFANELAKTFGWSRPTAATVITALIDFGLVARRDKRDANGRIEQVGYQALPPVLWQKPLSKIQGTDTEPLSKNQGTVYQGTVYQGTVYQGTRFSRALT